MTDLDKLKVCAEVAAHIGERDGRPWVWRDMRPYDPIINSDQALELEAALPKMGVGISISASHISFYWQESSLEIYRFVGDMTSPAALRRAIVEAVVKVKEGK